MQSKALWFMVGLALTCTACSGRTAGQRLNELEEQVGTTDSSLKALHGRVARLEQDVDSLRSDVRAQAQRKYEVRTKNGSLTNYVITPVVAAPVLPVKAPDLTPVGAQPIPAGQPVPGGSAAPVTPVPSPQGGVVIPPPTHPANISSISPATTGTAPLLVSPRTPQPVPVVVKPAPTPVTVSPAARPAPVTPTPVPVTPAPKPADTSGNSLSLPPDTLALPQENAPVAADALALPPEGAQNAAPATPTSPAYRPAPATPAPVVATPAVRPTPPQANNAGSVSYQAALREIMGGQLAQGRAHMQDFVQKNPQSSLVPNAHYWIGESYYAQRNYAEALAEFKQVSVQYPQHQKTADALLKAGMTYQRLGDQQNASLQFKALVADYPTSQAAQIARSKGWDR